MLSVTLTLYFS